MQWNTATAKSLQSCPILCDPIDGSPPGSPIPGILQARTLEYYSAIKRNTFESVLMRWMNLEPIIQSEVSKKEKNKYHILTYVYMESRKMILMNLFAGQQWRHRHREQTYGQGQGGGRRQ